MPIAPVYRIISVRLSEGVSLIDFGGMFLNGMLSDNSGSPDADSSFKMTYTSMSSAVWEDIYKTAFGIPMRFVRDVNVCIKEAHEDASVLLWDVEADVLSLIANC
jgi:hypothetical protein